MRPRCCDRCCARQTGHPLLSGEGDNTALVTESSGDLTPYRVALPRPLKAVLMGFSCGRSAGDEGAQVFLLRSQGDADECSGHAHNMHMGLNIHSDRRTGSLVMLSCLQITTFDKFRMFYFLLNLCSSLFNNSENDG